MGCVSGISLDCDRPLLPLKTVCTTLSTLVNQSRLVDIFVTVEFRVQGEYLGRPEKSLRGQANLEYTVAYHDIPRTELLVTYGHFL